MIELKMPDDGRVNTCAMVSGFGDDPVDKLDESSRTSLLPSNNAADRPFTLESAGRHAAVPLDALRPPEPLEAIADTAPLAIVRVEPSLKSHHSSGDRSAGVQGPGLPPLPIAPAA
jgi:hypothetical protein